MNNLPSARRSSSGTTTTEAEHVPNVADLIEIDDPEAEDLRDLWSYLDSSDQTRLIDAARALADARAALRALEERARRKQQIEKNQGAIQLLRAWSEEDAALTPEEQEAALAEWEQLERELDEEYLAGNRLLPLP
jgi:hypothetical protein